MVDKRLCIMVALAAIAVVGISSALKRLRVRTASSTVQDLASLWVGGIETMRAVYYAIVPLLGDQVAHCNDGSVWIQAETALAMAWSGVGEWAL